MPQLRFCVFVKKRNFNDFQLFPCYWSLSVDAGGIVEGSVGCK